ncbi:MAG TPA: hypothetical protein VIM37_02560 [Candidatus Microsaccharimonas sp.]
MSVFATAAYNTQKVGAVTTAASQSKDLDWQVKAWWYYNAMTQCMKDNGSWTMSTPSDVSSGNWFSGIFTNNHSTAGWYMQNTIGMGDDGQIGCNENSNEVPKAALKFFGLSGIDVSCDAGILVRQNGTNCTNGNGDFTWKDAGSDESVLFSKYIRNQVFGGSAPTLTDAMKYLLYRQTLFNACMAPDPKPYDTNPGGANVYKIADVNNAVKPATTVIHYYIGNQPDTFGAWVSTNPDKQLTCKQLAANIDSTGKGTLAGAAAAASDSGTTIVPVANRADGGTGSKTTCSIEGIGWILCPVANAIAGMTDALFGAVTAFMHVTPLQLTAKDNPLYTAWSVMRTIANVAFVVVFLIIIFSQLTSAGVSNYGVKKLLPRLVVGAILVNVSFYLCAVAVDLSNILGVGVQQLFGVISTASSGATDPGTTATAWSDVTSTVLAGVGTVGAGIAIETFASGGLWGAIAALLPLLVAALFALIVAFLVLLARQALIIMAIVVSPLAFVAFLLPNTESLFKKWRDLFMSLLVLFPLLSLVFGASGLAAVILRSTSTAAISNPSSDHFIAFFLYIGSFAVQVIPFFITPLLLKLSNGVLGRFAGIVNNPNKGPFDRLRKAGERVAGDTQNRRRANKVGADGFMNFGARRRARIARVTSGLEGTAKYNENEYINSKLGQITKDENGNVVVSRLAKRMAAGSPKGGQSISEKAIAATEQEHLKEAMQPLLRNISALAPDAKGKYLEDEVTEGMNPGGDHSRASAALHYAAQIGDTNFLRKQLKTGNSDIERMTREAINANPGSVIGKAPDLVKGAGPAFGSLKGSDIVQFKPDTATALITHLKSLADNASTAQTQVGSAQYLSDPKFKDEIDKTITTYTTAVNGLNSAIEDVSKSPELQGQFSADVGVRIVQEVSQITKATGNTTFESQLGGIAGIQSDGKIR